MMEVVLYATQVMMKNWPNSLPKPHVVADSGYGSFSLLAEIAQWEGYATMSIPSNECQKLSNLLGYNLPLDHWRVCIKNKVIFSAQHKLVDAASGESVMAKKYVISNAFKAELTASTVNVNVTTSG